MKMSCCKKSHVASMLQLLIQNIRRYLKQTVIQWKFHLNSASYLIASLHAFVLLFFLSSGLFLDRASSFQSYTNTRKRCYALIANIQYLSLNSLQFFLLYILFSFLFFYIYTQSTLNQLCYMKIFCAWCREIRLSLHHIFVCVFFLSVQFLDGLYFRYVMFCIFFYVFCTLFIPFSSD